MSNYNISAVLEETPGLAERLEPFQPIESAALLAGLLTDPCCHANTWRIETLVHLLVAFARGDRKPSARDINSWLNAELGPTGCARMEDPPEDVFISNVTTEHGNTRIFEGLWESSDFGLQRMLNVVSTLPNSQNANALRGEIRAVLRLSDEIASRRKLARFCAGGGTAKGRIEIPSPERLRTLSRAIEFSPDELQSLGVPCADLEPFIFEEWDRERIRTQTWGDTDLERRPIIKQGQNYMVLLPAALSVAIRRHVLEWMHAQGYNESFDMQLAAEYLKYFKETPVLGVRFPSKLSPPLLRIGNKQLLEFVAEVDAGRYLQVIAIIDGIGTYLRHGFSVPEQDASDLSDRLDTLVEGGRSYSRKQKDFRQGLTLIVSCGYGRPMVGRMPEEASDWWVESVSAPDLQALSRVPGTSELFLWKLISHERFLREKGVAIFNVNGLLNLYGWASNTEFFMLPSGSEFARDPLNIFIPTDCMTKVRSEARKGWDIHSLPFPDGKFMRVRRMAAESLFPEEARRPQYGCTEAVREGWLLGARVGRKAVWWLSLEEGGTILSKDSAFQIWESLNNWLDRAVPLLERRFRSLPAGPILIILDLSSVRQDHTEPVSEDVLRSSLEISADRGKKTIRISLLDLFLGGFQHPKNLAERELVRALANGMFMLSGMTPSPETLQNVVNVVVPNDDARYLHAFEATTFRDLILADDRPKKLFIDDADQARSKIGLGWLVRDSKDGNRLETADESVPFLNAVVETIWKRVRTLLRTLDRTDLIEKALRHIEGVRAEKRRWERTILAILALRDQNPASKAVAVKQIARCNASAIALRLVVEMGVCECPLSGGQSVGIIDLTSLMSDVLCIFHWGESSDAIKKGVMEPEIRIAPCGDVMSHVGFRQEIVDPLGERFGSHWLDHEASRYGDYYEPSVRVPTAAGVLPKRFLTAFEAEFGVSFDMLRGFRETLENLALEKKKCVLVVPKTEVLSFCERSELTAPQIAEVIMKGFSLWPRDSWTSIPKGFKQRDWFPWRFGRRLSLMARPLVRLEEADNPRYAISPGLLSEGMAYTLQRYSEADVDVSECRSRAMKEWISEETNRGGHAFARKVFEAMQALGYQARLENKVSGLLNQKLDRDWGDVDVLAWRADGGTILVMECKDLRFAKTATEIAEQLNRFKGQVLPNGERDELLKHIDRCNLLRERADRLARTIGFQDHDVRIQGIVCFSEPVPMQYIAQISQDTVFVTIEEIRNNRIGHL